MSPNYHNSTSIYLKIEQSSKVLLGFLDLNSLEIGGCIEFDGLVLFIGDTRMLSHDDLNTLCFIHVKPRSSPKIVEMLPKGKIGIFLIKHYQVL
jgi:hypothetical protein